MGDPLRVAFRADASVVIGSGHVMRCLMLARQMRETGAECVFICADLPGHMGGVISEWGMEVVLLPAPAANASDPADYASWSGLSWAADAKAVSAYLARNPVDWLVVDHYGLDVRWEKAALPTGAQCLVMDDLANRPHAARLLVDSGLGRQPAAYRARVPDDCALLLGPKYAVLRPEFAEARTDVLPTRSARELRHILITMGGVDLHNASGAVLDALSQITLPNEAHVTLVLGRMAPHLNAVRKQAASLPFPCQVFVDVAEMHRLMAAADVAIGAVGGTAWERCVLGLPSLMLSIADNQVPAARALAEAGAARYLGALDEPGWRDALGAEFEAMAVPGALAAISRASSALCDGHGAARLARAIRRTR